VYSRAYSASLTSNTKNQTKSHYWNSIKQAALKLYISKKQRLKTLTHNPPLHCI